MRSVLDEYHERMMVGEIYLPYVDLVTYYGQCHLPFNFQLILLPWKVDVIRAAIEEYESLLPPNAWPNWVLGNHDQRRIASRVGPEQARVANMLLLTLRGTPTTYYGEEIGMENGEIPPDMIQDPPAIKQPDIAHIVGRDPERTPMQWDAGPNAGFAAPGVKTWLPVASNYQRLNVQQQNSDPTSMLSLYRALTTLRRTEPALHSGSYASVKVSASNVLAYLRTAPGADRFLIVLNLSGERKTLDLSAVAPTATIVISTTMTRQGKENLSQLTLNPHEGLILR
jgi:alpha-glucosidase